MLTPDEKQDLRDLRDATVDEEDKRLLRKAINHMQALEARLSTVRTLLRAAMNETNTVRREGGE